MSAAVAVASSVSPPATASPESIVLVGQWVQANGKDMLLIDPVDQAYNILYADPEKAEVSVFGAASDAETTATV